MTGVSAIKITLSFPPPPSAKRKKREGVIEREREEKRVSEMRG